MAVAARRVRQLLQKRSSTSGASTADYVSLAALLPTLSSLQNFSRDSEDRIQRKRRKIPSRIGALGGMLPYVPCTIAPYDHPAPVAACFRQRLTQKDSLWIEFMGDSKVRELFYEFLHRSDEEYHYMLKLTVGYFFRHVYLNVD